MGYVYAGNQVANCRAADDYKVYRSDESYTKLAVSTLLAATRNAAMFAPVTGL